MLLYVFLDFSWANLVLSRINSKEGSALASGLI